MKEKFVVPKSCKECYYYKSEIQYIADNCSLTKEWLKDISIRGKECPLAGDFQSGYNFTLDEIKEQLEEG